ncbi:hypothetical protein ACFL59_08110 [Planctomycetota bacterium]
MRLLGTIVLAGLASATALSPAQAQQNPHRPGKNRPVVEHRRAPQPVAQQRPQLDRLRGPQGGPQHIPGVPHDRGVRDSRTVTRVITVPGHWETYDRQVYEPGRWEVVYETVTLPGHWEDVQRRVWVPEGDRRHRCRCNRPTIHIGGGSSKIEIALPFLPVRKPCKCGHYELRTERVWVPGTTEQRPVRKWIPPQTRIVQKRRWVPATTRIERVQRPLLRDRARAAVEVRTQRGRRR